MRTAARRGKPWLYLFIEEQMAYRWSLGVYADETVRREKTLLKHAATAFGDLRKPLRKVTPQDIRNGFGILLTSGASADTARRLRAAMKRMLADAEDEGLIEKNPITNGTKIPVSQEELKPRGFLCVAEAQRLVALLDELGDSDSRLVAVRLGTALGARVSEILALVWDDVDFDRGIISISKSNDRNGGEKSTKEHSSVRRIHIDEVSLSHLSAWKAEQARQLEGKGLRQDGRTNIVANGKGRAYCLSTFDHWFEMFCARNGFGMFLDEEGRVVDVSPVVGNGRDASGRPYSRVNPKPKVKKHYVGLRFHELRHTQATILLAGGCDLKKIQDRLGHAKMSTTTDFYIHLIPGDGAECAEVVGRILYPAAPAPPKCAYSTKVAERYGFGENRNIYADLGSRIAA